jgi:transcriptional regulator with XRE-family HTH domain
MHFKQNLIHCRKNRGLSQAKLAKELGLKESAYAAYENRDVMPTIPMLIKITEYFGHTIDDFLKAEPNE